jgi:hypothetical protein
LICTCGCADATVRVKISFEAEMRRFSCAASFGALADAARKCFGLASIEGFAFQYIDRDQDTITVGSSEELLEAIREMITGADDTLRLAIVPARPSARGDVWIQDLASTGTCEECGNTDMGAVDLSVGMFFCNTCWKAFDENREYVGDDKEDPDYAAQGPDYAAQGDEDSWTEAGFNFRSRLQAGRGQEYLMQLSVEQVIALRNPHKFSADQLCALSLINDGGSYVACARVSWVPSRLLGTIEEQEELQEEAAPAEGENASDGVCVVEAGKEKEAQDGKALEKAALAALGLDASDDSDSGPGMMGAGVFEEEEEDELEHLAKVGARLRECVNEDERKAPIDWHYPALPTPDSFPRNMFDCVRAPEFIPGAGTVLAANAGESVPGASGGGGGGGGVRELPGHHFIPYAEPDGQESRMQPMYEEEDDNAGDYGYDYASQGDEDSRPEVAATVLGDGTSDDAVTYADLDPGEEQVLREFKAMTRIEATEFAVDILRGTGWQLELAVHAYMDMGDCGGEPMVASPRVPQASPVPSILFAHPPSIASDIGSARRTSVRRGGVRRGRGGGRRGRKATRPEKTSQDPDPVGDYDDDDEYQCLVHLCRPLSDPVLAQDGRVYCRSCIEKWFRQCQEDRRPPTSPLTNLEIGQTLVPRPRRTRERVHVDIPSNCDAEVWRQLEDDSQLRLHLERKYGVTIRLSSSSPAAGARQSLALSIDSSVEAKDALDVAKVDLEKNLQEPMRLIEDLQKARESECYVYIDYSNIAAGGSLRSVSSKQLNDLVVGSRQARDRVLVGSCVGGEERLEDWKELGYQVFMQHRDAAAREQFVDDALVAQMQRALLRSKDENNSGKTLVLLSGDGNSNEGRASFSEVVKEALFDRGWRVEVWCWKASCSTTYRELQGMEGCNFSLFYLDACLKRRA